MAYATTDRGLALDIDPVGSSPLENKWDGDTFAVVPADVSDEARKVASVMAGNFYTDSGVEHNYTMNYILRVNSDQKEGTYTTEITYLAEAEV
jgi:hypothetical protein